MIFTKSGFEKLKLKLGFMVSAVWIGRIRFQDPEVSLKLLCCLNELFLVLVVLLGLDPGPLWWWIWTQQQPFCAQMLLLEQPEFVIIRMDF